MTDSHEIDKKTTLSRRIHPFKVFFNNVLLPVGITTITLGSLSEAFVLVDDFVVWSKTKFSNTYEYELLGQVNVGNTMTYVEDIMGEPAVVKSIDNNIEAKYYFTDKYLLTSYYHGERVSAYTVISLADHFSPNLPWDKNTALGESELADNTDIPTAYSFDNAPTNRFFIESSDTELKGFFQQAYLGSIEYGKGTIDPVGLENIYKAEVYGSNGESEALIETYRSQAQPNFYGQGELNIDLIQKGLLSNGEFLNFFGEHE